MTYERYDAGSAQPGARPTAPNVDRVMGLGASQESTVDRLLTVVERLTAELATTQNALHDLALEVARVGLRSGGQGTSQAAGTAPAAAKHTSALPLRQADHAVVPEIDRYVPGQHAPAALDGAGVGPSTAHPAAAPPAPGAAAPGTTAGSLPPVPGAASAAAAHSVAVAAAAAQATAAQSAAVDGAAPVAPGGLAPLDDAPRTDVVASLTDVQLLSAGAVDVMLGPVRSLADLDALEQRILALTGVEAVTVMAFEGRDVLMKIETERPLPLASMLRAELGRPVESCRLVEGRIAVTFAETDAGA